MSRAQRMAYLGRLCGALERCDKALMPGPWELDIDDAGTPIEMWTGKFIGADDRAVMVSELTIEEARAIAELRGLLPALIEEIGWAHE